MAASQLLIIVEEYLRICSHCKTNKSVTEYYDNRSHKDGLAL